MRYLTTILFLLVFVELALAQTPFITNYPPDVYKSTPQNWASLQDNRGVLYFGNNNGVLEFDGITWKIHETRSAVRSMAKDSAGRIYLGMEGDFGYLQADHLGINQYKSLKEKIAPGDREFYEIWDCYALDSQVFFLAEDKIFVLQDEELSIIRSNEMFDISFLVNNTYYVREQGSGLMIFKNGGFQLVQGGERFAHERIFAMLPYGQTDILIATRSLGLWVYSPLENRFYKPAHFDAVAKFLSQHPVYCGKFLKNGSFAIGTLTGGIVEFNEQGRILNIYNTESGLPDNAIYNLYTDNNQQLWTCTGNGISLIQNNLPFQRYIEKNGLKGTPMSINYFDNRLYVSTMQYLCVQNPDGSFETVPGTEGQNWQLQQHNGTLLLANFNGLFKIEGKQALPVITSTGFVSLDTLSNKPNNLLAGLVPNGLCLLEYRQNRWSIKNTISGFNKPAYKIVQDKDGSVWVTTYPGIYRLRLSETMDSALSVQNYTAEQGLPISDAFPYRLNSGQVVFATKKGIYRYNSVANMFEPHPDFPMITGLVQTFQQHCNGDIWFQETKETNLFETGILKYSSGSYHLVKHPFYKFKDYIISGLCNFCFYADGTVIMGTNKGLLHYNPLQEVDYNTRYNTLIRKVNTKDSLLFGGTSDNFDGHQNLSGIVLPYKQNNVVFHYAATFYEDVEKNLYSFRLLGSDTTWSGWVGDVKKEFSNLFEGKYTFEVRAKNQYNVIGSTASFSFRVLPPWYRTWWAYSLYFLFFIGFTIVTVKIYTRRLEVQKNHLEQLVKERTFEVLQQKEEILQTLEVVSHQKVEIEKSHKHITNSINYAKHIQRAVLPKPEFINELLPEHFILFKPLDIVSGDFYFIKQVKNYLLVAAADCTGHGVPGALMSMMGVAMLNEIVQNPAVDSSAKVLTLLRQQIKQSLQQTGEIGEQYYGMDIAFCAINLEDYKMSFAGAHNPCYVLRQTGHETECIVLPADPQPLGLHVKEKPFSDQTFQIYSGDVLYIFSDGFHSQFGEKNNSPMKTKRFKEMLSTVYSLPMCEQKQALEKRFNEWKGSQAQTDDVLVMGIKIL